MNCILLSTFVGWYIVPCICYTAGFQHQNFTQFYCR